MQLQTLTLLPHCPLNSPTCTTGQNTPDSSSSPLLRFMPKNAAGRVAVTAPSEMMLHRGQGEAGEHTHKAG